MMPALPYFWCGDLAVFPPELATPLHALGLRETVRAQPGLGPHQAAGQLGGLHLHQGAEAEADHQHQDSLAELHGDSGHQASSVETEQTACISLNRNMHHLHHLHHLWHQEH